MKIVGKALVMFLFSAGYALAAGEGEVWTRLGIPDPNQIIIWAGAIALIFIAGSVYYRNHMGKTAKKVAFFMIAVPIIASTLYLSGSTVYLNTKSATGGPVHWHADYEVWACGIKYDLADPTGWDNRVGPPLLHEHNDNRIHVEGVPLELSDVTLGEFFRAVGGEFTGTKLTFPTNLFTYTWKNGDLCNGQPARWYAFINEQLTENAHDHVYAPYSTVPPGDVVKLVFTEKQPDAINPKLFEVP